MGEFAVLVRSLLPSNQYDERADFTVAMLPLELLRQRTSDHWLVGQDSHAFLSQVDQLIDDFTSVDRGSDKSTGRRSILIAESDPIRFLAGFLAAQSTFQSVFLGNPSWGETEWQQALALAQPDQLWGDGCEHFSSPFSPSHSQVTPPDEPLILIPTGGSSGKIKFVMHRWGTLAAAVEGFQGYFQVSAVNSICVLPLYHVSGLMQFMRSFLTGGELQILSFKQLKNGPGTLSNPSDWFISLVPTQLQALLAKPRLAKWLARCKTVFVGGAPSWPDLLTLARSKHIPLSLCYGMTETAAQVVALKPQDFLAGHSSAGQVLPHAQVDLMDDQGMPVPVGTIGQVQIAAESLALGYYPTRWAETRWTDPQAIAKATQSTILFQTDDSAYLDDQGYLTLVGRLSHKIITGGENVFPAEIEAAIRATGLVTDVVVVGLPDSYWGQCVTAIYVPCSPAISFQKLVHALQNKMTRYKHPKIGIPIDKLPRNSQGKLNYQTLLAIAREGR